MLTDLRANDTQTAGNTGSTAADIRLAGNIVEVDPTVAFRRNNALAAHYHAVFTAVKSGKDAADLIIGEHLGGFGAPAGEDFIGVVMVVMTVVVIVAMTVVVGVGMAVVMQMLVGMRMVVLVSMFMGMLVAMSMAIVSVFVGVGVVVGVAVTAADMVMMLMHKTTS